MKPLFARNIGNTGRLVRGLGSLALLIGAGLGFSVSLWLGAGWRYPVCLFCSKPCAAGV